ncbi:tRNA (adenosine(37)-N6)-dimethylallyltransferase MiaA [Thiohalobacter sp. IOR34]|uniref:tRNA (adenosine(37)-N6)-dimethylallyltransferase MiaA n=1 Tax=Thiohalobacter sp. IOR34 TaxID=3057176 RepID=UPI0025AFA748|nr:tRNA (adenosine(37)-N6)-dimethylallyltransferase MiaA [Thiohalobacter sp. IOR34]WJW76846.1 tRNA (adenosine(37)-N6)-dimethylallyltransferase MiaA [Thiohalobacter sp. IOR34]
MPPAVLCLMGPTAAGKTALALRLVEAYPFEIVSVDSAMVYRGMDIGTAKPEPAVLAVAPHRLIDILDPGESYSAARFAADAQREIEAIRAAGRQPLLVGGTGLYFRALEQGLAELPAADAALRAELEAERQRLGLAALHRQLAAIDPQAAARIHPNDAQRILRALEVCRLSGRSLSELCRETPAARRQPLYKLVIAPPQRAQLHPRIEQRLGQMLEQGLVEEVERLRARDDLHADLPSMRAVGYRQVWQYLDGESDYATMCQRVLTATRQYAKRQYTWLRAESGTRWFDPFSGDLWDQLQRSVEALLDDRAQPGE